MSWLPHLKTQKTWNETFKEVENNLFLKNITHKFEELGKMLDDESRIMSRHGKEVLEIISKVKNNVTDKRTKAKDMKKPWRV